MANRYGIQAKIKSLVYGLGGKDFFKEDVRKMIDWAEDVTTPDFDYYGVEAGCEDADSDEPLFAPITRDRTSIGATTAILPIGPR